jgi:hypothetical protein
MTALGKNIIRLLIDDVERKFEVSKAVFTNAESASDFLSFGAAEAGGGRDWSLNITFVQDPGDSDSLWNLMFDHAGETVDVLVNYYGVDTPSDTQPSFSSTVRIKLPDGDTLGGEADASESARQVTEVSWPCTTGQPTRVTSGVAPTITAVSPATGGQGSTVAVAVTGTGFDPSPTVTVSGTGVTVSSVTRPSAALIYAQFTMTGGATISNRSVTVTNTDATTVTAAASFAVTA